MNRGSSTTPTGFRAMTLVLASAMALVSTLAVPGTAAAKGKVKAKIIDGTLVVTGTGGRDVAALRLADGDPGTLQVDTGDNGSADASFDRSRFGAIAVSLRGGNDSLLIDDVNGSFTVVELTTISGGDGDDRLTGGSGGETLIGDAGDDALLGGGGDDTFVWDSGDGSDLAEGHEGFDTVLFTGSGDGESTALFAQGERVTVTRDVGGPATDLDGVESVRVNVLGGADRVMMDDLTGTDVTEVWTDLSSGGADDGAADSVTVNGTSADDVVTVVGDVGGVLLAGLSARLRVTGADSDDDILTVKSLAGDDVVDASGVAAGAIRLTVEGGDGADVLIGGDGNDFIFGGEGDDVLLGGPGLDVLDGGPGDNIVIQD